MTFFIAEVCSNHNGNLDRCLAFVDKSAELGCGAVKFQLFNIRQLFAPEIVNGNQTIRDREKWELPKSFLPAIAERCNKKRIQFGCTPFYLNAVDELRPFVDFYKIASYELLWTDLLVACARTKKPVILSTGMATLEEVDHAVLTLTQAGCQDLTLMHCVSAYPTPASECNLSAIETLRQRYQRPVGWSDHSMDPGVLFRAIHRWNALSIEFHLDLDGHGEEYRLGHCWLPNQIHPIIEASQNGMRADGNGEKVPAASERVEREWRRDATDGLRPLRTTRRLTDTK